MVLRVYVWSRVNHATACIHNIATVSKHSTTHTTSCSYLQNLFANPTELALHLALHQ